MGLCENCKITMCRAERDDVIGCAEFVAKDTNVLTNADRIRAMSDEELAKILNALTAYFEECNRSSDDVECKNCELYRLCSLDEGNALEWLKQPAEPPKEE